MATEPLYVSQLADVNREAELAVRRLYKIPAGGTLTGSNESLLLAAYTELLDTYHHEDLRCMDLHVGEEDSVFQGIVKTGRMALSRLGLSSAGPGTGHVLRCNVCPERFICVIPFCISRIGDFPQSLLDHLAHFDTGQGIWPHFTHTQKRIYTDKIQAYATKRLRMGARESNIDTGLLPPSSGPTHKPSPIHSTNVTYAELYQASSAAAESSTSRTTQEPSTPSTLSFASTLAPAAESSQKRKHSDDRASVGHLPRKAVKRDASLLGAGSSRAVRESTTSSSVNEGSVRSTSPATMERLVAKRGKVPTPVGLRTARLDDDIDEIVSGLVSVTTRKNVRAAYDLLQTGNYIILPDGHNCDRCGNRPIITINRPKFGCLIRVNDAGEAYGSCYECILAGIACRFSEFDKAGNLVAYRNVRDVAEAYRETKQR